MQVTEFENQRWATFTQKPEFRHTAALDLIGGGDVLDFACGDGVFLEMLRNKGVSAVGLDISATAVDVCKKKGLEATLMTPGEPWPFPDNHFDYVVMLDVLEHVYDPLPLLSEAKRVSKKFVVIGVPNFSSLPARMQTLFGNVPENNRPQKGHVYWFNYPVLQKIVSQSTLKYVEKKMNTFSIFKLFASFFLWLSPNIFALSFIVTLEK